jgi:hypothetical protein
MSVHGHQEQSTNHLSLLAVALSSYTDRHNEPSSAFSPERIESSSIWSEPMSLRNQGSLANRESERKHS